MAYDTESTTSRGANNDDDDDPSPENTDAELKDSLERLDERTDVEKELYTVISKGDFEAAERLISENRKDIDINHKNLLGHDLLTHAVKTRKKKIIALVLTIDPANVKTQEALLHAIKEDRLGIVMMLLYFEDHKQGGAVYAVTKRLIMTKSKAKSKKKMRKRNESDDSSLSGEDSAIAAITLPESFDDSEYGWGMTPFMQAAIHGRYEILQVLYNRGERLPEFHPQSCACSLCESATRDLERTQRRINLLKAECNPTYMIFMAGQDGSYDPVYKALELTKVCTKCAEEEPEFSEEYNQICEGVSKVPIDLMNMCRTCDEVKIFLSQSQGYKGPKSMPYPRLAYAIKRGNKELVSHPNIQFFLQTEFMGPIWKTPKSEFERIAKFAVTALMMLFFPVVQLFLWFSMFCCSSSPTVRYLLSPINRAMSKLASYIFFCILLFIMNKEPRAEKGKEMQTIYVRYIIVIYTIALLVGLIRRCCMLNCNIKACCSGWNGFDLITQVCLWCYFAAWGCMKVFGDENAVRDKLQWDDWLLIEECCFAVASTVATLRLLRWYILSRRLGPFQAGLHRMAKHVPTVVFFMTWTVFSFSYSSKILFRPYLNLSEWDARENKNKDQPKGFTKTDNLFLDFYVGDIGPDDVEILSVNDTYLDSNNETKIVSNDHKITGYFAMILCILWNIVGIKFLQESVTGLFGSTGTSVLEAKDVEWNYDRAKEMLYYIQDGHLAPPFNLIPNGACLASWFGWIYATTCGKADGKTEAGCSWGECCYLRDVENPEDMEEKMKEYPYLLRNLFLRYFKSKKDDDDTATKEDVNEVQGKVKELRALCKLIVGYESPIKGQSKASNLSRTGSIRPIQPNTQPSESNSQQGVQNNNDPLMPMPSTSQAALRQQSQATNSMQVVKSPKSKSKSRTTTTP